MSLLGRHGHDRVAREGGALRNERSIEVRAITDANRDESEVGECIAASGLPRAEVFITTKVWVTNYPSRQFAASVDESLRKLRTDCIDLLLLHWPSDGVPLSEQIGALDAVAKAGKVPHIGVGHFNRVLMAQAIALSEMPPATNRFEYHPYLNQSLLIDAARETGLAVTAYCGMADISRKPGLRARRARQARADGRGRLDG